MRNFMNILSSVAIVGIISTGMTLVIITKGIDLSVSSTIALSGCLLALGLERMNLPWYLAMLMALSIGTLGGMLNGLLITKFRVPPFIATLGTLNIMRGVAFISTDGQAIFTPSREVAFLGAGYAFGIIPVPAIITLLAFLVLWAVSRFTVFGRQVFAVGGNPVASRLSGINVNRIKFTLYTLTGFLSAVSGMVMVGLTSTAMPSAGDGFNLDVITAVYLGGNSSEGGEGSIWRTLLGVLIIGLMNNGMALLSVPTYWQTFAKGCLLIIAVVIDVLRRPAA
jgi:ribose/xylose/arabinose/galactoside ABC-type transport system permease subunit